MERIRGRRNSNIQQENRGRNRLEVKNGGLQLKSFVGQVPGRSQSRRGRGYRNAASKVAERRQERSRHRTRNAIREKRKEGKERASTFTPWCDRGPSRGQRAGWTALRRVCYSLRGGRSFWHRRKLVGQVVHGTTGRLCSLTCTYDPQRLAGERQTPGRRPGKQRTTRAGCNWRATSPSRV